jgi:DNA uptake protein ComE-like DNA-binding protein
MNGLPHSSARRRGSVLIVVLILSLGLVSLTLLLAHSMMLAYRGSDNEVAGRQADMAIEGAAQYAEAVMDNATQPGAMPDLQNYQYEDVPLGDARFWFIGEPDPSDSSNLPAFGLVDEASKLNLNTASLAMLENLPGMTQDLAQSIVAWRTSASASPTPGTTTTAASTSSSEVKNAPFESVEELAQVNGGTDLLTLYGTDTNLNHVLDPDESAGGASASSPGLMEYVTVFSRQPNRLSTGARRINVTQTSGALSSLLGKALGSARGAQITNTMRRAGAVHSVLEFYNKSGMSAAEFALVSGSLSMSNAAYSTGLINVNTASETVLECVPGITASMAQQIISTREGQQEPVTNLSWVAPILGRAVSSQAGPYLTAETYQVSADVAAVGAHGRGYRRTLFIIDNSTGTPQVVYRRNLAGLGWALGGEERQALAKQEASP